MVPADLPDELQRSILQFIICGNTFGLPQFFDVSAHLLPAYVPILQEGVPLRKTVSNRLPIEEQL